MAIGSYGEDPPRWWDAAGKPIEEVPFRIQGAKVFKQPGMARRQLVFRIHNLPKGSSVVIKSPSSGPSATGEVVFDSEESPPGYYSDVFGIDQSKHGFVLRVGVAIGPWETVAEENPLGSSSHGLADNKGIIFPVR